MLVPTFTINQDQEFIIINIKVPYVKISKSEFYIEQFGFKFFLHPYLLNLTFQNPLKEAEDPHSSVYNHETYILTVKLKKKTEGEFFEDLQMLTKLMNKPEKKVEKLTKKKAKKTPLIQVLGEESKFQETEGQQQVEEEQEGLGQQFNLDTKYKYGFNDQYQEYFVDLEEEIMDIGELNPDNIAIKDRTQVRDKLIFEKFDEEHYLFDFFDNEEEIMEKFHIDLEITKKQEIKTQDGSQQSQDQYTPQEWDTLIKLPNKQFILNSKTQVFLQIVDIAFAYLYELRCFDDEFTCESQQTINKLSSTLSCFIVDKQLKEVLIQSYKRALSYPLYRHFELCEKVQKDLAKLLSHGKLNILKLFLHLKNLFDSSDPRYLLNRIYIEDFLIIIQQFKDEEFVQLSKEISSLKLNKKADFKDIGLSTLEQSAEIVMGNDNDKPATEEQLQAAQQLQQKPEIITEEEKKKEQEQQEQQQQIDVQQIQQNKTPLIQEIPQNEQQQQQKPKVLIEDITDKMDNTNLNDLE